MKVGMIVYVFSLLFTDYSPSENSLSSESFTEIILKFIFLVIYAGFTFFLSRRFFFMQLFSTGVIGSIFSAVLYLNISIIEFKDIFPLGADFFIMCMSFFFMVRYFREHSKKNEHEVVKQKNSFFKNPFKKKKTKKKNHSKFIKETILPDKLPSNE